MFISIVLNTQYMDYSSRIKWYLKNLYHCKKNGWAIITHAYLAQNLDELQKDVDDRFFGEFEMDRLSTSELQVVPQYLIPDELFEVRQQHCGSRTEMLFDLYDNRFPEFENVIRSAFNDVQKGNQGKIEGVFHCMEPFHSLRKVCDEFNIPCISYVFSAIRRVHGYRQTLYSSNMKDLLYSSSECAERYERFMEENQNVPLFDNREIIAILGKERTLPLISLLDSQPEYEMCICGEGYLMIPDLFLRTKYTDEDIYYECNKLFPRDKIRYRQHRMQLNQLKMDHYEVPDDPASTILSSKRVTAHSSQILLKALLWNRTAVMKKDTIPFSFMCEKDYLSVNKIDLMFLNYYIFCYLIPSEFMFDQDYWLWRLGYPSELDKYHKHLAFYSDKLGIEASTFKIKQKDDRFRILLEARKCDQDLIDILLQKGGKKGINYEVAVSKLLVERSPSSGISSQTYWRLNESEQNTLVSRFTVNRLDNHSRLEFYPLDDRAGMVRIVRINFFCNDELIQTVEGDHSFSFFPKKTGSIEITPPGKSYEECKIECIWEYETIKSWLENKGNK